jgi:hypothetical protein
MPKKDKQIVIDLNTLKKLGLFKSKKSKKIKTKTKSNKTKSRGDIINNNKQTVIINSHGKSKSKSNNNKQPTKQQAQVNVSRGVQPMGYSGAFPSSGPPQNGNSNLNTLLMHEQLAAYERNKNNNNQPIRTRFGDDFNIRPGFTDNDNIDTTTTEFNPPTEYIPPVVELPPADNELPRILPENRNHLQIEDGDYYNSGLRDINRLQIEDGDYSGGLLARMNYINSIRFYGNHDYDNFTFDDPESDNPESDNPYFRSDNENNIMQPFFRSNNENNTIQPLFEEEEKTTKMKETLNNFEKTIAQNQQKKTMEQETEAERKTRLFQLAKEIQEAEEEQRKKDPDYISLEDEIVLKGNNVVEEKHRRIREKKEQDQIDIEKHKQFLIDRELKIQEYLKEEEEKKQIENDRNNKQLKYLYSNITNDEKLNKIKNIDKMKKYINFTFKNNIETFRPDPDEFQNFVNNLTLQIKNKHDEEQKLEIPRLLNKMKEDIRNNEYDNDNYRQNDLYGRYRKSILENSTLTNKEAIDLIKNTIKTTLEENKLEAENINKQRIIREKKTTQFVESLITKNFTDKEKKLEEQNQEIKVGPKSNNDLYNVYPQIDKVDNPEVIITPKKSNSPQIQPMDNNPLQQQKITRQINTDPLLTLAQPQINTDPQPQKTPEQIKEEEKKQANDLIIKYTKKLYNDIKNDERLKSFKNIDEMKKFIYDTYSTHINIYRLNRSQEFETFVNDLTNKIQQESTPATQFRPVQESKQQITRQAVQEPPPLLEIPMLTLQELENQNKTKMFKEVLNKKDEEMAQKLQETENQLVIYGQPIGKEPRSEKQKTLTNFENQILQNQPPIPAITEILKPADEFNDPPVEDIKKFTKKEQANIGFNEKSNIFNFTIGPYVNFCQTTPGMRKPTEDVQAKLTELVFQINNMPGKKITCVDLIKYKQDTNIKSVNQYVELQFKIKRDKKIEQEKEEKKAKK